MKPLTIALLSFAAAFSFGQVTGPSSRQAVRIPVYHADPYFIKAMLEGKQVMAPEISALFGALNGQAGQAAQQAANGANAIFDNGFFIVNPTDNSLWFFFNKSA